jgi:hypothetical protein
MSSRSAASFFFIYKRDTLVTLIDPDFDDSDDSLLLRPCWHELHPDAWCLSSVLTSPVLPCFHHHY